MSIRILFLSAILLAGAWAPPLMAQPDTKSVNTSALIDSLDRALFKTYIFPDKSRIIINYLRRQLKQGAYDGIADMKDLAAKIQRDMHSVHRDDHLRVHHDPGFAEMLARPQATRQMNADSAALTREQSRNFGFRKVEVLDGNIGYVEFAAFSGMVLEAKSAIKAAFTFISNTEAIIIDLRKNGGGSPHMVRHIYSYFVSDRTRLNDIYDRRVNKTMEFWADPADADNMKLSMPVYILTSDRTFSAAEDFTYAMQVNKRGVIVGDSTGGGAHPTGPVYIGQNFVVDIPFARSINHITKTDWEGTGVIPDVQTQGQDALLVAQNMILKDRLKDAKTEGEKISLQWQIDALKANDKYENFSTELLNSYEGTYGRFSAFVKDKALFLKDFLGRTFRLKPIAENHFLGDDWFQVQFLSNGGNVSQMKMIGKPGWVDVMEKQK